MDQYYTQPEIIENTAHTITRFLKQQKRKSKKKPLYVVDFSAGDGKLGDILLKQGGITQEHLLEFDIDPKHERVVKRDWLEVESLPNVDECILCFNPPFGKSAHKAYQFLDHALQLPNVRIVAIFCILPLVPIEFEGAKSHTVSLLPPKSFFLLDDNKPYSAPACMNEVIAKPSSFLQMKAWVTTPNKPYHYDIRDRLPFLARDIAIPFCNIKDQLPIAVLRKNGFYAGMTAIIIEPTKTTLLTTDREPITQMFDPDCKPEERPWVCGSGKWHMTSFTDDLGEEGCYRSGCGTLKILPAKIGQRLVIDELTTLVSYILDYVKNNKEAVQGGGNGPKNIGAGTAYWIAHNRS